MQADADPSSNPESESTGLPLVRSWRSVYAVVTVIVIGYIVLLAGLTRMFQ